MSIFLDILPVMKLLGGSAIIEKCAFYGRVSQLVPVRPSGQRQRPLSASQTELPGPQWQLIVQLTPYRPTSHAAYNIALILIFVDHFSRPRRAIVGPLCVCVCADDIVRVK